MRVCECFLCVHGPQNKNDDMKKRNISRLTIFFFVLTRPKFSSSFWVRTFFLCPPPPLVLPWSCRMAEEGKTGGPVSPIPHSTQPAGMGRVAWKIVAIGHLFLSFTLNWSVNHEFRVESLDSFLTLRVKCNKEKTSDWGDNPWLNHYSFPVPRCRGVEGVLFLLFSLLSWFVRHRWRRRQKKNWVHLASRNPPLIHLSLSLLSLSSSMSQLSSFCQSSQWWMFIFFQTKRLNRMKEK